jgi:hypothetical protein
MTKLQRIRPYLWLFFIICTLGGGHYLFYKFSFEPLNAMPMTRGLTFGSALWSAVLVLAMLLHKGWARYVLIVWLVFAMALFGLATLLTNTNSLMTVRGPTLDAMSGLALFALALAPLGASRSLRRYLAPRTAGGR